MSTIKFTCSNCGVVVHAPAEAAGKRGRCPSCKHRMMIPAAACVPQPTPAAKNDVWSAIAGAPAASSAASFEFSADIVNCPGCTKSVDKHGTEEISGQWVCKKCISQRGRLFWQAKFSTMADAAQGRFEGEPLEDLLARAVGLSGKVDSAALLTLARIGPDHTWLIPQLTHFLQQRDSEFARARATEAVKCLGRIGPAAKPVAPALAALLDEPDLTLPDNVMDALCQIYVNPDEDAGLFVKVMSHQDPQVRQVAASHLAEHPGEAKNAALATGNYYAAFRSEGTRLLKALDDCNDFPIVCKHAEKFLQQYGGPQKAKKTAYELLYNKLTEAEAIERATGDHWFWRVHKDEEAIAQRLKHLMKILYPQVAPGGFSSELAEMSGEWQEIRQIGEELNCFGGFQRMLQIYHRMRFLYGGNDGCLSRVWHEIGDWSH